MTAVKGKRVLVTGGVGLAVVKQLAAAEARVVVTDRDETKLKNALAGAGLQLHSIAADLTQSDAIKKVFDCVDEHLGGLDILIACTGMGSGPLMEMKENDWRTVINTNLLSYRLHERCHRANEGWKIC